jgi:hypothetical protein
MLERKISKASFILFKKIIFPAKISLSTLCIGAELTNHTEPQGERRKCRTQNSRHGRAVVHGLGFLLQLPNYYKEMELCKVKKIYKNTFCSHLNAHKNENLFSSYFEFCTTSLCLNIKNLEKNNYY